MKPTPKGHPRISQSAFYPRAATAIDWLCEAFGFDVQLKVEGEGGRIEYSELVLPGGLVTVGEAGGKDRPWLQAPASLGGGNTQNMFVYVDDVEAHCARAREAGATIVFPPTVSDYGEDHWADRNYECVDLAGHHWWFAQRLREAPSYAPKLDAGDLAATTAPPKGWPRISSSLYYDDASAAIDWLCQALGFEVQIRVEGEAGRIEHSELVLGGGLVMVSEAVRDTEKWAYRRVPAAVGGACTQCLMIFVDDTHAACERARGAGATITQEPKVSDYGDDYWTDLSGEIQDLGGHRWWLTQRLRG